jgi:hypothetical protein
VIFHDDRLGRVVDHDSLARNGLTPETTVGQVTWGTWQKLVTKGGEHLTDLQTWLKKMGRWHVPCMIEVKYLPVNPAQVVGWVSKYHAPASFYALPIHDCGQHAMSVMKAAGARIGLKYNHRCPMSPSQIASFGYDYVITSADMSRKYVNSLHSVGVEIGCYNARIEKLWPRMVDAGYDRMIVPRPGKAERWLR